MSKLSTLTMLYKAYVITGKTNSFDGWLVSLINVLQSRVGSLTAQLKDANDDADRLDKSLARYSKYHIARNLHNSRIAGTKEGQ